MVAAVLGKTLPFDGTEDVECELTPNSHKGVQIISVGFVLSDVVVTIESLGGAETEVTVEDGAAHALIAEGFTGLTKVTLSGFSAGSYSVTFIR